MKGGTDGENCHEIPYFLSLTNFKSCESRDNEIVIDLLTTLDLAHIIRTRASCAVLAPFNFII